MFRVSPPGFLFVWCFFLQALYKATVERFVRDVEEVEKRFGAKILCEKQRQMLHQKTIFE